MTDPTTDYIVFAPLREEVNALCKVLGVTEKLPMLLKDGTEYFLIELETASGPATVMICRLSHMGVLGAGVMATKLIEKHRPLAAVSFGIAGGFVGDDVHKRDVLLPAEVLYYEPAKEVPEEGGDGDAPHGQKSGRPDHLSRVRHLPTSRQMLVLGRRIRRLVENEYGFRCIVGEGPLASGEKKIADLDGPSVRLVKKIHSKTLGIEMEAAGVGAAVEAWPELRPIPQFWVVKGISDDASAVDNPQVKLKKQTKDRKAAARNAALVLKRLLDTSDLQRVEESDRVPMTELRSIAGDIITAFPRFLTQQPLQEIEVLRVIDPLDSPPPIFYHWRISEHLHWLDFLHLLIFRKIHNEVIGCPIYLLVTDRGARDAAKSRLLSLVQAMFGSTAMLTFYSELAAKRTEFEAYARQQGFDEHARDTVLEAQSQYELREGNLISVDWIQYIAWECRLASRGIVVVWHRSADAYRQILNVIRQRFLLVLGADILLGGKLGKFEAPGKEIYIDPPSFESFRNQVGSLPPRPLEELLSYFSSAGLEEARLPKDAAISLDGMVDHLCKACSTCFSGLPGLDV